MPTLFMIKDLPIEDQNFFPRHVRSYPPQTIRVVGKLRNTNVTILINGKSTHKFIDQKLVTKFELPVVKDKSLQVMVVNQEKG